MPLPGVRTMLRAVRRAAGVPAAGRGLVLLYHRVARVEPDPWDLCVSPQHFEAQLRVLRTLGTCVHLRELSVTLAERRSRRPVFSITFDDGYADNATAAAPLLVKHGVPATVFVVSGMVNATKEFWWDALARVFLLPGELPPRLRLAAGDRVREWDLGRAAVYSETDFRRDRGWRADSGRVPGRRQEIFLETWKLLVGRPSGEREALASEILEWAKLKASAPRPDNAVLSSAEFERLAGEELIEIGAHTRSHPSLPDFSIEDQVDEIAGGKADLETLLGRPVASFSYPFGRFTQATEQAVREAGFATACTTRCRAVTPMSKPLSLPRVHVKDWDGPSFRKIVMSYLCN